MSTFTSRYIVKSWCRPGCELFWNVNSMYDVRMYACERSLLALPREYMMRQKQQKSKWSAVCNSFSLHSFRSMAEIDNSLHRDLHLLHPVSLYPGLKSPFLLLQLCTHSSIASLLAPPQLSAAGAGAAREAHQLQRARQAEHKRILGWVRGGGGGGETSGIDPDSLSVVAGPPPCHRRFPGFPVTADPPSAWRKSNGKLKLCKKCELNMRLPGRNVYNTAQTYTHAQYGIIQCNNPICILMPGGNLWGRFANRRLKSRSTLGVTLDILKLNMGQTG